MRQKSRDLGLPPSAGPAGGANRSAADSLEGATFQEGQRGVLLATILAHLMGAAPTAAADDRAAHAPRHAAADEAAMVERHNERQAERRLLSWRSTSRVMAKADDDYHNGNRFALAGSRTGNDGEDVAAYDMERWRRSHASFSDREQYEHEQGDRVNNTPSLVNDTPSLVNDTPSLVNDMPSLVNDTPSLVNDRCTSSRAPTSNTRC